MGIFDYIIILLIVLFIIAMAKRIFSKKDTSCHSKCNSCPMGDKCNKKEGC